MTMVISTRTRNYIAQQGSWKEALDNCHIDVYSGGQPSATTADVAPTGNKLLTLTLASGAKTNEVCATGVVTLTVGATTGDTVATLTLLGVSILGAAVAWNTSLTQTAADACTQINRNPQNKFVRASNVAGVITLTALPGWGSLLNSAAMTGSGGGNMVVTMTSTSFGSATGGSVAGVSAVNGLRMEVAAAGIMLKDPTQVWSGVVSGAGTQTAGWFRIKGSIADNDSADDSNLLFIRIDGTVATSGAQMNIANTSMVNGVTRSLNDFSFTIPAIGA